MAINIYWTCPEEEWMRATEPESVVKRFYELKIHEGENPNAAINYCPSFNAYLKNVYAVKSLYDYKFSVSKNEINSTMYNQDFFEKHVLIRSIEKKFFSFSNRYIFFTDSKSLQMSAYQHPIFEQNEISKRCMIVPGSYDIGKWFRPLEFPFVLKNDFDNFSVKYNDVLYYLKFHTEEKIVFKQFYFSDKLKTMTDQIFSTSINKMTKFSGLSDFYAKFKIKPLILKEINSNLL